jgi:hypothetical protein
MRVGATDQDREALAARLGELIYGPRPQIDPQQAYAAAQFGYKGPIMQAEEPDANDPEAKLREALGAHITQAAMQQAMALPGQAMEHAQEGENRQFQLGLLANQRRNALTDAETQFGRQKEMARLEGTQRSADIGQQLAGRATEQAAERAAQPTPKELFRNQVATTYLGMGEPGAAAQVFSGQAAPGESPAELARAGEVARAAAEQTKQRIDDLWSQHEQTYRTSMFGTGEAVKQAGASFNPQVERLIAGLRARFGPAAEEAVLAVMQHVERKLYGQTPVSRTDREAIADNILDLKRRVWGAGQEGVKREQLVGEGLPAALFPWNRYQRSQ